MKQEIHHHITFLCLGTSVALVASQSFESTMSSCVSLLMHGACFPEDGAAVTALANKLRRWAGVGSVCRQ